MLLRTFLQTGNNSRMKPRGGCLGAAGRGCHLKIVFVYFLYLYIFLVFVFLFVFEDRGGCLGAVVGGGGGGGAVG